MKIRDYMVSHEGEACVRINYSCFGDMSLILGFSKDYHEIFYYVSIDGKRQGPYVAEQSFHDIIDGKLKEQYKLEENIPERWDNQ
ncbi:hypothetical protein [Cytobacillus oceanisediminis]|uniref:hypothetical protein n=1 Tax=Cytobacillus oceanisediminis TaxID=665099 RepID=UPI001FB2E0F2|nr:hypothetical protein [Cytobacillus oceanisediminis]UOE58076.1 hypothetical protein IRB79_27830 [Cytobacillus oceanisediminis]